MQGWSGQVRREASRRVPSEAVRGRQATRDEAGIRQE